jgi:hypothetical protein
VNADSLGRQAEAQALALRLARDGCNPVQVVGALMRRLSMPRDAAVELCNAMAQDLAAADLDGQCALFETAGAMARGETESCAGMAMLLKALEARCGWQLDADKRKALAEGSAKRWGTLRAVRAA